MEESDDNDDDDDDKQVLNFYHIMNALLFDLL